MAAGVAFLFPTCMLFCAVLVHPAPAYDILALFPYPLRSHFIMFESLLLELAARGHQVTVVTSFPRNPAVPNYTQIDVADCFHLPAQRFEVDRAFAFHSSLVRDLFSYVDAYDTILQCEPMQRLKRSTGKFQLIVTEIFSSDAMLAFAHHFDVPFISFCSTPLLTWAADRVGNPDNPSYISFGYSDNPLDPQRSTFFQRAYNTYAYVISRFKYKFLSETKTDGILRKHFGPYIPPLEQIARNTSLIFTFSHFSINMPRPTVPGVIEIGGIQIKPPSPLPYDIKKFIDDAEDGVIYFCLGSLLQARTLPKEKRNAFAEAFAQLPQRVLWKYEEDLPGTSHNVMIRKWMPQRDILAHRNVRLFISHGGALGLNEAVYEGVPILSIPIWADQTVNIKSIVSLGVGEMLAYPDINTETLVCKIRQILNNNRYKEKARQLSAIYRDRPLSAIDTAVYWTEYVIRHRGAHFLRTQAVEMPWYQYLLIDVAVVVILMTILLVTMFLFICKILLTIVLTAFRRSTR